MTEIKARYRNKLKKVIVEVWNGEKWLYVLTLSDPLNELNQECLDKCLKKCLEATQETKNNDGQKFVYEKLSEQQKKDISLEDLKREQDKLMGDILKGGTKNENKK